jgi:exosome complex RNA-binding protein Rrp4
MIVAPDGYIIDVFGPYKGTVNDAAIMKQVSEQVRSVLGEGDVLVDRGFREAVDHLTALDLDVRMPDLNVGKQLTTEQANRTRLVTKCRWIVEARNGHLKRYFRD